MYQLPSEVSTNLGGNKFLNGLINKPEDFQAPSVSDNLKYFKKIADFNFVYIFDFSVSLSGVPGHLSD